MVSSYTTNKNLEKPGNGDYVDTWNVPVNSDMDVIDAAFGGVTSLNATGGSAVLTSTQYQKMALNITGAISASVVYTIPSGVGGIWVVRNATTDATGGPWSITISSGGGGTSVVCTRGKAIQIYSDGTNIRDVSENVAQIGTVTSVDVSGGATGLTTSGGPITSSGTITIAGTLGISNGGTGITSFGTGVQTALGQNATGSGGIVLANNPSIGTPATITLTNATGLPISTGVSGLGTNVATFLSTPTSANLAAAVTDETGSGSLVFGTSPTIATPTITGNTTINGATSGAITVSVPAVAGTNTVTLPAATGTAIVSTTAVGAITGTPSASTYLRGDGTWAGVSASGQLIRTPRIFTSGTSYTTPAGCNNLLIEMIGGGGGGSGNVRTNTSDATGGGGGGASPYGSVFVAVTPNTTYTYAIGAGGAGVSGIGTATTGGTTSITISGTTYSCSGGAGGVTSGGDASGTGGASGTATNMNVTITPISSSVPAGGSITSPLATGLGGMFSFFAVGGNTTGRNGLGYGAGGGGSWNQNSVGTSAGGAGASGIIRIWEYT